MHNMHIKLVSFLVSIEKTFNVGIVLHQTRYQADIRYKENWEFYIGEYIEI